VARPASFGARGGWWVVAQVPIMLAAAAVPPMWGAALEIAQPLCLAGIALTLLGAALAVVGLAALGGALTPFPQPLDGTVLRQSGIYALARHPIYGGLVIASAGWALAWQSVPGGLVALAVALFFDRKAAFEERLLRERFPGYGEYAGRVKKLIPGIY